MHEQESILISEIQTCAIKNNSEHIRNSKEVVNKEIDGLEGCFYISGKVIIYQ